MTDSKQAQVRDDAENVSLGKRAVRCSKWQWLPGMQALEISEGCWSRTYRIAAPISPVWLAMAAKFGVEHRDSDPIPDLRDPATRGCLLELVRMACEDHAAVCVSLDYGPGGIMWQVQQTLGGGGLTPRHYGTEKEALVAALENSK